MFRRILVPLDGSRFAEHALPRAIGLSSRFDAALDLFTVAVPYGGYPPPVGAAAEELDERVRVRMREYLASVEKRIRAEGFEGSIRCHALPAGNVVGTLLGHLAEHPVDLVVMTTHGRGAFERAWLGSTADGFIRRAPCPTLLLRPRGEAGDEVELRDVPDLFGRVLVPLDGSEASKRVVPIAESLAKPGASMVFLRAVPPLTPRGYPPYLPHVVEDELDYEKARRTAEDDLHAFVEEMNGAALTCERKVLTSFQPSEAILRTAKDEGADLIAMSTAGRGGVARLLIGSVADKVIRGTTVPLLLHREPAD